MIGKEILGYHVDEKIGSGGFGTVYKVSKTNAAGTQVRALKHMTLPTKKQYASVLNSMGGDYAKADDYFAKVLQDIVSEIQLLSVLSESATRNIVRYYENDIVETPSPKSYDIYIMMEYLTPFPDYFDDRDFTVKDVIALGKDILSALIACHQKNVIHRDIKDDNIFVSSDGVYKLGDFGVSKSLKDKSRAESIKGTPNFIAPEVYLGKEKYDHTVDVYSLGIVLYKLLNKSRNPFMPTFPAPYSTEDEDAAFEARMKGQIPELPFAAKNALGEAVLKAVMPREHRYDSAQAFLDALCDAETKLTDAELAEIVNVVPVANGYQKTIGVTMDGGASSDVVDRPPTMIGNMPANHMEETVAVGMNSPKDTTYAPPSDKHLFDTFAAPAGASQPVAPTEPVLTTKPTAPTATMDRPTGSAASNEQTSTSQSRVTSFGDVVNTQDEPKVAPIKKGDFSWLVYLTPFLIVGIYVVTYLIIIPKAYGKVVSIIEWLFSGPANIIASFEALKDPSTILAPVFAIIGLKIFNWVLVIAFIASLFFVGHTIQNKKPKVSMDAQLVDKEAYQKAIGLMEEIKLVKDRDVSKAYQAVKSVCERLKNESAFGSGSAAVINCENEIATCLAAIESTIPALYQDNTAQEAMANIEMLSQKILSKLKVRIELKKK